MSIELVKIRQSQDLVAATPDEITRKLSEMALGLLFVRFIKFDKMTDEEYLKQLPASSFDALFYIQLIQDLFSNRDRLMRVLEGDLGAMDDFPLD